MIQDIFLRVIVTTLFVLSAVECLFATAIATSRRTWVRVIGLLLQFIMSIAMISMAWPWGATLPTLAPLGFFLVAAIWFVAISVGGTDHRVVNGYHALKMSAMAWMYAVMNGDLLPGQGNTVRGFPGMTSPHQSMPDTDMPGMDMSGMTSPSDGDYPWWINAIDWVCMTGFTIAAAWWLYRYVTLRKAEPIRPWHDSLGAVRQAMMAAGMAIMFGVML